MEVCGHHYNPSFIDGLGFSASKATQLRICTPGPATILTSSPSKGLHPTNQPRCFITSLSSRGHASWFRYRQTRCCQPWHRRIELPSYLAPSPCVFGNTKAIQEQGQGSGMGRVPSPYSCGLRTPRLCASATGRWASMVVVVTMAATATLVATSLRHFTPAILGTGPYSVVPGGSS